MLDEILQERVVSSRGQRRPRGVKRKMSNFPLRPRGACCSVQIEFSKCIRIVKGTVLPLSRISHFMVSIPLPGKGDLALRQSDTLSRQNSSFHGFL